MTRYISNGFNSVITIDEDSFKSYLKKKGYVPEYISNDTLVRNSIGLIERDYGYDYTSYDLEIDYIDSNDHMSDRGKFFRFRLDISGNSCECKVNLFIGSSDFDGNVDYEENALQDSIVKGNNVDELADGLANLIKAYIVRDDN